MAWKSWVLFGRKSSKTRLKWEIQIYGWVADQYSRVRRSLMTLEIGCYSNAMLLWVLRFYWWVHQNCKIDVKSIKMVDRVLVVALEYLHSSQFTRCIKVNHAEHNCSCWSDSVSSSSSVHSLRSRGIVTIVLILTMSIISRQSYLALWTVRYFLIFTEIVKNLSQNLWLQLLYLLLCNSKRVARLLPFQLFL